MGDNDPPMPKASRTPLSGTGLCRSARSCAPHPVCRITCPGVIPNRRLKAVQKFALLV